MGYIGTTRVPPQGPDDAEILFIGEAPGEVEELLGEPFIGQSGEILDAALQQNLIDRKQVRIMNLCNYRLAGNNFDYAKDSLELNVGINEIMEYIAKNKNLKVIVLLGNAPLFYITGRKGIKKWRGTAIKSPTFPNVTILSTFHPAFIAYNGNEYSLFSFDIGKINRILKGDIQKYDNDITIIDPRGTELVEAVNEFMNYPELMVDIESVKGTIQMLCCGFSYKNKALCIVNHSYNGMNLEYDSACRKLLENKDIKKVLHNCLYDVEVFYQNGIETENIHWDTMIAQHAIDPELPKSLAHCISIYTDRPYHKDMGKAAIPEDEKGWSKNLSSIQRKSLYAYNCLDCFGTGDVYEAQQEIIKDDKDIAYIFGHMMDLIPVSRHMSHSGMLQNEERMNLIRSVLIKEIQHEQLILNSIVKTDHANANSPKQMKELLYSTFGLPVKYNGRGDDKKITADEDAIVELVTFVKNKMSLIMDEARKLEWATKAVALGLIMKLRGKRKLISSYIDTEISSDGRYRSTYNITGAESGRLSCSSYVDGTGNNAQTFPREVMEYE